jgi:hypothetical protein
MRRAIVCCLLLSLFAAATPPIADGGTITWSFDAGDAATCPKSISVSDGKIVVDLSALPNEAKPFRAVFRCQRERNCLNSRPGSAVCGLSYGSREVLTPRIARIRLNSQPCER